MHEYNKRWTLERTTFLRTFFERKKRTMNEQFRFFKEKKRESFFKKRTKKTKTNDLKSFELT